MGLQSGRGMNTAENPNTFVAVDEGIELQSGRGMNTAENSVVTEDY
jgi:hypothetical protein